MLAWMNEKTLEKTVDEEIVTYWSRSREKLDKRRGIGPYADLGKVQLDCDGDALLLKVRQKGGIARHWKKLLLLSELDQSGWTTIEPVLKLQRKSIKMDNTITALDKIISERKDASPAASYVAQLHSEGLNKILEKFLKKQPRLFLLRRKRQLGRARKCS